MVYDEINLDSTVCLYITTVEKQLLCRFPQDVDVGLSLGIFYKLNITLIKVILPLNESI